MQGTLNVLTGPAAVRRRQTRWRGHPWWCLQVGRVPGKSLGWRRFGQFCSLAISLVLARYDFCIWILSMHIKKGKSGRQEITKRTLRKWLDAINSFPWLNISPSFPRLLAPFLPGTVLLPRGSSTLSFPDTQGRLPAPCFLAASEEQAALESRLQVQPLPAASVKNFPGWLALEAHGAMFCLLLCFVVNDESQD